MKEQNPFQSAWVIYFDASGSWFPISWTSSLKFHVFCQLAISLVLLVKFDRCPDFLVLLFALVKISENFIGAVGMVYIREGKLMK